MAPVLPVPGFPLAFDEVIGARDDQYPIHRERVRRYASFLGRRGSSAFADDDTNREGGCGNTPYTVKPAVKVTRVHPPKSRCISVNPSCLTPPHPP